MLDYTRLEALTTELNEAGTAAYAKIKEFEDKLNELSVGVGFEMLLETGTLKNTYLVYDRWLGKKDFRLFITYRSSDKDEEVLWSSCKRYLKILIAGLLPEFLDEYCDHIEQHLASLKESDTNENAT